MIKGHKSEVINAIRGLPSMQVAVAFQGASDALAPESGALLGDLGKALDNPKLANSRFVIGVQTNSVGSDEYNLDLSGLRAKAIADTLSTVREYCSGAAGSDRPGTRRRSIGAARGWGANPDCQSRLDVARGEARLPSRPRAHFCAMRPASSRRMSCAPLRLARPALGP